MRGGIERFIADEVRLEITLLAGSLDDCITADNSAGFVVEHYLTALAFAGAVPKETGPPARHPATLLKIHLYGHLNRVPSGRQLERYIQRDVELIWPAGRLMTYPKPLADFRKDNGPGIQGACAISWSCVAN